MSLLFSLHCTRCLPYPNFVLQLTSFTVYNKIETFPNCILGHNTKPAEVITIAHMEIPLFPVGELVLLPGMALPLYVFEPRYRELLGRIRQTKEPFGIPCVLPAQTPAGMGGAMREPEARIARVATLAHLVEVQDNPDGTANILVVGGERFRILDINNDKYTYSCAEAKLDPLEPSNPKWTKAVARDVLEKFLDRMQAKYGDVSSEVPDDMLLKASFVAANLRLSGTDGQRILEAKSLFERFEILSEFVGVSKRVLN